ncbi:MAG: DHH family phosphoesterase [Candidatus Cloacimonetes bacterium]|nr:DHH family phosphoesterase [Candidatus Cloacimonadota bacterium]
MRYRWLEAPEENDFIEAILQRRGYYRELWEMSLEDLPDEKLFANIQTIATRIQTALYQNEPLVIFGHDDPDGVSSAYILYRFFNSLGYQNHKYYIPNRNLERHGIQDSVIRFVQEGSYKFLIVVDNGITSKEGVERLQKSGCETVIIDHHLIQPDSLPEAYAIMNPQLGHCDYPFKALAGVGVVLMLIRYLARVLEHRVDPSFYFWTAVGSFADKVPMVGLNWLIVRHVMDNFDNVSDYTIDFLRRNNNRLSNPEDVFYFIQSTARLIANGREENGNHTAMRFLLQVSDAKASLFEDLERQKNKWENDLNYVFKLVDTLIDGYCGRAFIYYDDEDSISYGLLGTAASYTVNQLGIPTIYLKSLDGLLVCEGRCSDGFNMTEAFASCKDHLIQFGGHVKAAGFTMKPENYDSFINCFNEYVLAHSTETTQNTIQIDAEIFLTSMVKENWDRMQKLMPFGQQNCDPVLLCRSINATDITNTFNIENGSIIIPQNKTLDILFNWKSQTSIKIIDWYEH